MSWLRKLLPFIKAGRLQLPANKEQIVRLAITMPNN